MLRLMLGLCLAASLARANNPAVEELASSLYGGAVAHVAGEPSDRAVDGALCRALRCSERPGADLLRSRALLLLGLFWGWAPSSRP